MKQLFLQALLTLILLLSASFLIKTSSMAAEISGCSGPSENNGGETLSNALAKSRSCQSALKTYKECSWGSSADTRFSAIVIGKCEQDFIKKLNAAEMKNYADRMQLCAYRYSMVQGTLYMSIAATCQADLAASFSANPSKAKIPLPRASFDCAKAKTPVEKTICAAPALGRADLVLNDSYHDAVDPSLPPQDKQHLADHQRQWLERTVAKCKPDGTADQTIVNCLRSAFEARFTAFEQCSVGGTVDCVDESEQEESAPARARASFDCDKPETALEVVICADSDLGQTDIDLAAAYKKALAETHDPLRGTIIKSERSWLKFVETSCPLGVIGAIPPLAARLCVKSAFKQRVVQLGRCSSDPKQDSACFWQFSLFSKNTDTQPPVAPHSVKLLDMPDK